MHRQFKELLGIARGYSELIVAVFVDVRGFSGFSHQVESREVGLFVRKLFTRLVEDYFPDADFWKSTGDGLLIVVKIEEESEALPRAQETIETCFRLLEEAPQLFEGDFLVNFKAPTTLGIGISRGAACRLGTPDDHTLDYCGHVLNLAARLMDMARPTGIVVDGAYGISMMSDNVRSRFDTTEVYVQGVSPKVPVKIWYSKDMTVITPERQRPIDSPATVRVKEKFTFGEIAKMELYSIPVESRPEDKSLVRCQVVMPSSEPSGRKSRSGRVRYFSCACVHSLQSLQGRDLITVDMRKVRADVARHGAKANWPVTIELSYPER